MANQKISELTLKPIPQTADTTIIVDSSDPANNKKITLGSLPISALTQAALNLKADKTNTTLDGQTTKINSSNVDINPFPLVPNVFSPLKELNLVNGSGNAINSDNNIVFGDNNQMNSGGKDFVVGDSNQVNASDTLIYGTSNQSNGGRDTIIGKFLQNNLADSFSVAYNPSTSTDFDFRVSRTNGVEFGQIKDVGSQTIMLNKDGKLISKGTRLIYVNSKDCLLNNGTRVGNVITLRPYTNYCLLGDIDLMGDKLVLENSSIFSFSTVAASLKSTGLVNQFLIETKRVCQLSNFVLDGLGATYGVTHNDVNGTLVMDLMSVVNAGQGLNAEDASNYLIGTCNFINSKLTFKGAVSYVLLNLNLFLSTPGGTAQLLEFTSTFSVVDRVVIFDNDLTQNNAGQVAIAFLAGFTAGAERIQLKDNSFQLAGGATGVLGMTAKDLRSVFRDNEGIQNGAVIGNYYNTSNALVTDIITVNVPVKVNSSATTANSITNKFTHTTNRLTYTGLFTKDFIIHATASVQSTSANDQIGFYIAKNGAVLVDSLQTVTTLATGRSDNVKVQSAVSLATNDFIELWVMNRTDNSDVTVIALNVMVEAKN